MKISNVDKVLMFAYKQQNCIIYSFFYDYYCCLNNAFTYELKIVICKRTVDLTMNNSHHVYILYIHYFVAVCFNESKLIKVAYAKIH